MYRLWPVAVAIVTWTHLVYAVTSFDGTCSSNPDAFSISDSCALLLQLISEQPTALDTLPADRCPSWSVPSSTSAT
jgi:hypothetical protein